MKFELKEHEGCFAIEMTAESLEEAARLVRMGMNTTMNLRSLQTLISREGQFEAYAVFAKNRRANGYVPKRR